MKRIFSNLKYVFLIMSLLLIFNGTIFAQGIKGDINDDDSIDLADVIMTLQVISGLNPGGISVPIYPMAIMTSSRVKPLKSKPRCMWTVIFCSMKNFYHRVYVVSSLRSGQPPDLECPAILRTRNKG